MFAPDPFDAVLDARSEARTEVDPALEPEQWEIEMERQGYFVCGDVDESGGLRGDSRG